MTKKQVKKAGVRNTSNPRRAKSEPLKKAADNNVGSGKITGSDQQLAIWDAVSKGNRNLIVRARAGTGKTYTIIESLKRLGFEWRLKKIGFVAFNRAIADELSSRLPSHAEAMTLHKLGLSLIRSINPTVRIDSKGYKTKDFINEAADELGHKLTFKNYGALVATKTAVARAKGAGLFGFEDLDEIETTLAELIATYSIQAPLAGKTFAELVKLVLCKCGEDVSRVDFDDMIWLPIRYAKDPENDNGDLLTGDAYHLLMVDEAQDLDPLQIELVTRMAKRIVAVGDEKQAIYGFRGAGITAMDDLKTAMLAKWGEDSVEEHPLTITWRCPKRVVELAKKLVPDYEAAPDAKDGVIRHAVYEQLLEEVSPGDMVLCRLNAPNFRLFFRMLRAGVRAFIRGRDIGADLTRILNRVLEDMRDHSDMDEAVRLLNEAGEEERVKLERRRANSVVIQTLEDKYDCLVEVIQNSKSIQQARNYLETMFDDSDETNAVQLTSVHKAKGLEASRVYVLEPSNMPLNFANQQAWEAEQERNIMYVAFTRAIDELVFVGGRPTMDLGGIKTDECSWTPSAMSSEGKPKRGSSEPRAEQANYRLQEIEDEMDDASRFNPPF